jgi:hypothetical protein
LIKVIVEYTILKDNVVKISARDSNDLSATSLERALAAGLIEYTKIESGKILPKNNINDILNNIGKNVPNK